MRVVVGRLGRAHGIRGELTVEVRTDAPEERFSPGASLFCVGRSGLPATVTVQGARWQGGRLVVRLAGVTDRTSAETLRGALLEADVDLAAGEDDEFHDLLLVGLEVRDRGGAVLGSIAEVLHLPAQDVLAVATPGGELLVPFVAELVPVVDPPGGFVVVELPEGLVDLGSSGQEGPAGTRTGDGAAGSGR